MLICKSENNKCAYHFWGGNRTESSVPAFCLPVCGISLKWCTLNFVLILVLNLLSTFCIEYLCECPFVQNFSMIGHKNRISGLKPALGIRRHCRDMLCFFEFLILFLSWTYKARWGEGEEGLNFCQKKILHEFFLQTLVYFPPSFSPKPLLEHDISQMSPVTILKWFYFCSMHSFKKLGCFTF